MTNYKRVEYDSTPVLVARADTQDSSALAQQATKLANARSIKTDLGSSSQASFDGSADVTPGVSGVLPIANGGTGSSVKDWVGLTGDQTISDKKEFTYASLIKRATTHTPYTDLDATPFRYYDSQFNTLTTIHRLQSASGENTLLETFAGSDFARIGVRIESGGTAQIVLQKSVNGVFTTITVQSL